MKLLNSLYSNWRDLSRAWLNRQCYRIHCLPQIRRDWHTFTFEIDIPVWYLNILRTIAIEANFVIDTVQIHISLMNLDVYFNVGKRFAVWEVNLPACAFDTFQGATLVLTALTYPESTDCKRFFARLLSLSDRHFHIETINVMHHVTDAATRTTTQK